MNSKNIVTIIIVVASSALIVGIFIFYGGSKSAVNSNLQVQLPVNGGADVLSKELLAALSSLKDLKLDDSFFKDPALASLIDYSGNIVDEPIGRDNPFLPVGVGAAPVVSLTTSPTTTSSTPVKKATAPSAIPAF